MDQVIKERFATTIEEFLKDHPFPHGRSKIKGQLLKDLLEAHPEDMVIAVSPIHYARFFNPLIHRSGVIPIELQDSPEHIFQRLIFADADDNIYEDEEYKQAHKAHYLSEIREEIRDTKPTFKKIVNKYSINNQPVETVVDELAALIQDIAQAGSRGQAETISPPPGREG